LTTRETTPDTAAPRAREPWRAVLLSGLVLPGLGQLVSGRVWRGLGFAAGTIVLLAAVVLRVIRETARLLPEDEASLLDPALPFRLAVRVQQENAGFFLWTTIALIALWIGSILDAWRGGRRRRDAPGSGRQSGQSAGATRRGY